MSQGFKFNEYIVRIDGNEPYPIYITDEITNDEMCMTFEGIVEGIRKITGE
jgi:hypothetical protein